MENRTPIIGAMHRSRGRRVWPLIFSCPWLSIVSMSSLLSRLALNAMHTAPQARVRDLKSMRIEKGFDLFCPIAGRQHAAPLRLTKWSHGAVQVAARGQGRRAGERSGACSHARR